MRCLKVPYNYGKKLFCEFAPRRSQLFEFMEQFNFRMICFDSVLFQCIATVFKVLAPIYSLKVVLQTVEILEAYEHLVKI